MRERKSSDDEHKASAPLWIASYGDMVTNLLVFFVLLFSFSTIDANKWKALVISFTGGNTGAIGSGELFDDVANGDSDTVPMETEPGYAEDYKTGQEEMDDFERLYHQLKTYVDESGLNGQLDLIKSDSEVLIRFRDNVIFDSGKADIKPGAENILGHIAEALVLYHNDIDMIRIEGHTDDVPIHNGKYASNWELSTARAVQVLRYFIEKNGLDPMKLSAVGYSEYHPIADNSTEAGRSLNRRVDIVIAKSAEPVQEEEKEISQ